MNMPMKCLQRIPLLISAALIVGCTTPGKDMLPKGGDMTMPEIYQQASGLTQQDRQGNAHLKTLAGIRQNFISVSRPNYVAYTATAKNEVNQLFMKLPNPNIPFYIYPHLVHIDGEAFPKPGITSSFFLYRANHFAMPNEKYA